jgi:LDH2 family malate/lactate/ureidoglycolate dehydrogenase
MGLQSGCGGITLGRVSKPGFFFKTGFLRPGWHWWLAHQCPGLETTGGQATSGTREARRGPNRVADVRRYRLDDLRRFATALAAGLGVPPARASALASLALWFDTAGAAPAGLAALPDLLDRIEAGSVDPRAEGAVGAERTATAVFDGRHGIPLLALERAGGLAAEKARDAGVGIVRVQNVGPVASGAVVAAELAVGPLVAVVLGPGPSWSVALPSEEGLPAVFDPSLAVRGAGGPSRRGSKAARPLPSPEQAVPWLAPLAPEGGWLVAAVSVASMEPLTTFHRRVADALKGLGEEDGRLLPAPWEARRREARERGMAVAPPAWKALSRRAERLGVETPDPV